VGDLADRTFLGGALRPRAAQVTLRHIRGKWEVDVGAVHGVVADSRLAVHRVAPLQEVRVVGVGSQRSVVVPVGWSPAADRQYDMVLIEVPLPPVAVSIRAHPDVAAELTQAVGTAGPGGGPSPHIRVVAPGDEPGARLLLRARQADETLTVTSADHEPLAPAVGTGPGDVARTVHDLEHIARWMQVRNLTNPASTLEDAVQIEVVPAPGRTRPPRDARPLPAGNLTVAYRWSAAGWEPPRVVVRLRNTTGRKLFCVLLDLTDRYKMHADLFPGEFVAGHWVAETGGGPVTLSLPPDRPVVPGASVTDWLVLLAAEEPFSSSPFTLPRLREVGRRSVSRPAHGISGVVDRLGLRAVLRDVGVEPEVALDWTTKIVEITTRVPELPGSRRSASAQPTGTGMHRVEG
jgi:hypothetical protein